MTTRRSPLRRLIVALGCCCHQQHVLSFQSPLLLGMRPSQSRHHKLLIKASSDGTENQALEAIQSLADFHEGSWQGTATSFTVSIDTAAGIVKRRTSPPYTASVKLGMDLVNRDYTLTETLQWQDDSTDTSKVSSRTVSLQNSNADVDTVDASFSMDSTLPTLPAALLGTEQLPQFLIEHVLAVNDDERARCLVLYGVDQSLLRIVLCHELRVPESSTEPPSPPEQTLTAADLLEMQSDVDRLVDKIAGTMGGDTPAEEEARRDRIRALETAKSSSSTESSEPSPPPPRQQQPELMRHGANLLELTSGVWLGDLILRDKPSVPLTPEIRGEGFGAKKSQPATLRTPGVDDDEDGGFAKWSIGVQKAAWRWMWDFGDEIRQVTDYGKGLGAEFVGPGADTVQGLPGEVCVNQGLSRRMAPHERMVYIDWKTAGAGGAGASSVSFLLDSYSVQVPRFLAFDGNGGTKQQSPFYTEFGVYQRSRQGQSGVEAPAAGEVDRELSDDATNNGNFDIDALPEVVCSKIARVYNFEGLLKQGCTSFFTLKRFGSSDGG